MKKSAILLLLLAPLLAGCADSDWDRLLNYGGSSDEAPVTPVATAAAAPAPVVTEVAPVLPPNAAFCQGVATQDATSGSFDPATQQKVLLRSFQQCVAVLNR